MLYYHLCGIIAHFAMSYKNISKCDLTDLLSTTIHQIMFMPSMYYRKTQTNKNKSQHIKNHNTLWCHTVFTFMHEVIKY